MKQPHSTLTQVPFPPPYLSLHAVPVQSMQKTPSTRHVPHRFRTVAAGLQFRQVLYILELKNTDRQPDCNMIEKVQPSILTLLTFPWSYDQRGHDSLPIARKVSWTLGVCRD